MLVSSVRLILALWLLIAPAQALEGPSSPWSQDMYSALRLVGLGGHDERLAVVEITLKPGFKTYWRYPGDSGVPPQFNWAGSENLAGVEVLWPAPLRFSDASGQSIGYQDVVRFPVRFRPVDASKPVRVRLQLDYAVCEKLCLPAHGNAELSLPGGPSSPQMAKLLASVPKARLPGYDVRFVAIAGKPEKPFVVLEVDVAPGKAPPVDLFVEGPDDGWALPLPLRIESREGRQRYKFQLDGIPRSATWQRAALTVTLVTSSGALQKTIVLPE